MQLETLRQKQYRAPNSSDSPSKTEMEKQMRYQKASNRSQGQYLYLVPDLEKYYSLLRGR